MDRSTSAEILGALGFAVFERNPDGTFTTGCGLPAWSGRFHLSSHVNLSRHDLCETFPLLDAFLSDAEEFWEFSESVLLDSGPWTQSDASGTACTLQAMTITASGRQFLLLSLPGAQFEEGRAIIQRARDQSLAYSRMERQVADLESRNREMEKSNRLKYEFLAGVRQEVRTLVNAIIGSSALLTQETAGTLNEKHQRIAGDIGEEAGHLLHIIDEMFDISRVEMGRLKLHPEVFTFGEGLRGVLPAVQPLALAKRVKICSGDADSDLSVFADRVRFRQVLYNLLRNAVKFTQPEGSVSVTARHVGAEIEVTVSDGGPAILPAKEGWTANECQVEEAAGFQEGPGAGLAITKRLVEQHGGQVTVRSAPGRAGRFSFTMPSGLAQTKSPA